MKASIAILCITLVIMATITTTEAANLMRYRMFGLRQVCTPRLCTSDIDCCAGGCCSSGTIKCYDRSADANNCPPNIAPSIGICLDELFNC